MQRRLEQQKLQPLLWEGGRTWQKWCQTGPCTEVMPGEPGAAQTGEEKKTGEGELKSLKSLTLQEP